VPSAKQDWKESLFAYVNLLNEVGLHGEANSHKLREISDAEHRKRLSQRLYWTARREAGRGIKQLRSEMRAKIERQNAVRGEAVVDLAIHSVRSYEQRGQPWLEERVERERVRFVRVGGGWRLDAVQPLALEDHPEGLALLEDDHSHAGYERITAMPSFPYMNPKVLYEGKSRVYAGGDYGYSARGIPYRREAAVAYAERWWNEPNGSYENFDVNCTNYVSQCIFAGGAPMNYTGRRESGWWYKGRANGQEHWSYSWAVANALQHLLTQPHSVGLRATAVGSANELQLGDVICYDWDGNGRFQHNTIVTAFTPDGMPLVNANTVSSRHRYWDYRDSYAWTEQTRYRFFHITDDF